MILLLHIQMKFTPLYVISSGALEIKYVLQVTVSLSLVQAVQLSPTPQQWLEQLNIHCDSLTVFLFTSSIICATKDKVDRVYLQQVLTHS